MHLCRLFWSFAYHPKAIKQEPSYECPAKPSISLFIYKVQPILCSRNNLITYWHQHTKAWFCCMSTTKAQTRICIRAHWSAPWFSRSGRYSIRTSHTYMKYFNILHTRLCSWTIWVNLYLVVNHKDTFSRDGTHICLIFCKQESTTSIIFGVYFHLPPYVWSMKARTRLGRSVLSFRKLRITHELWAFLWDFTWRLVQARLKRASTS